MNMLKKSRKRQQVTPKKTARTPVREYINLPWKRVAFYLLMLLPVIGVIATYQWIQNPENLTIKTVEVTGDLKVLDKKVLQPVIEPYAKTNLYLLDSDALEKDIEANPWVHSASMTKVWPDKLVIKIFEQKPVAYWGKHAMLADNGEIIEAVLENGKADLPTLFSPNEKGRNMATGFLKIRKWMEGFPLKIVQFKEDTRGSWQVKLENGMTLKIGRNQQEKRLRRFMVGYKERLINVIDKISVVDLRYTNGFSVKWKKGLSADSVFKGIGDRHG